jgi:hypothetical protein
MPDENPYRYEGTAESLAKAEEPARAVRSPSGNSLFFAGLFAALVAAVLVPMVDLANSIPNSLCLLPFDLLPIGIYIGAFAKRRDHVKAQIVFWIAALPLGLFFVALLFAKQSRAQIFADSAIQEIGKYLLLDYGSQLLAAAVTMGFMTCRVPRQD